MNNKMINRLRQSRCEQHVSNFNKRLCEERIITSSQCAEVILVHLGMVLLFFFSCSFKAKIMFEVEGEMQGRMNINEANVSVIYSYIGLI